MSGSPQYWKGLNLMSYTSLLLAVTLTSSSRLHTSPSFPAAPCMLPSSSIHRPVCGAGRQIHAQTLAKGCSSPPNDTSRRPSGDQSSATTPRRCALATPATSSHVVLSHTRMRASGTCR